MLEAKWLRLEARVFDYWCTSRRISNVNGRLWLSLLLGLVCPRLLEKVHSRCELLISL